MEDAAFIAWVRTTYGNPDRHWVRRNLPALEAAYRSGLQPKVTREVPERRNVDRYADL